MISYIKFTRLCCLINKNAKVAAVIESEFYKQFYFNVLVLWSFFLCFDVYKCMYMIYHSGNHTRTWIYADSISLVPRTFVGRVWNKLVQHITCVVSTTVYQLTKSLGGKSSPRGQRPQPPPSPKCTPGLCRRSVHCNKLWQNQSFLKKLTFTCGF